MNYLEIPFNQTPQWIQNKWNELWSGTRPRVKVYRTPTATIHTPYSDYTSREIIAYNSHTGEIMSRYVPPYDTLISSTPEDQSLYFGGAVNIPPGNSIAVMDKTSTTANIEWYVNPEDWFPPLTIAPTLTERQIKILATTRAYISTYRREVFRRNNVMQYELDELQTMGLLDKRGAITINGRNIVGQSEAWY